MAKSNETLKSTMSECEFTVKQLKDELEAQKAKAKASAAKKKPAVTTVKKQTLKFTSTPAPIETAECPNCAKAKTGEPVNKSLVSDN